ncbi:hypothetical protein ABZT17_03955 [Streptomyces sp. NPDC005648]
MARTFRIASLVRIHCTPVCAPPGAAMVPDLGPKVPMTVDRGGGRGI